MKFQDRKYEIMRSLFILTIFLSTCGVYKASTESTKTTSDKFSVSGKLQQKRKYCGGAHPSQEMLAKFKIPKPLKEYKIYVKHGSVNDPSAEIIDSSTTNELGDYSFSLPSGEYIIVSQNQLSLSNLNSITDQEYIEIYNQNCLDNWFSKGIMQFIVMDKVIKDLNLTIHKKCNIPDGIPCLKYTGPLRP